jgi:putative membrane protein insertion efficiency factor
VSAPARRAGTGVRKAAFVVMLAIAAFGAHDLTVPPGRGYAARGAIAAIDGYRSVVSPRIGSVVTCRFTPTCSAYGREAFSKYGFAKGLAKTSWRIARCGPWTSQGTTDLP